MCGHKMVVQYKGGTRYICNCNGLQSKTSRDCNQRVFRTTLIASIALLRTTLSATETAIIRMGLHSMAPGPHYLQLIGLTAAGPPATSDPVRPRYAMDRAGC